MGPLAGSKCALILALEGGVRGQPVLMVSPDLRWCSGVPARPQAWQTPSLPSAPHTQPVPMGAQVCSHRAEFCGLGSCFWEDQPCVVPESTLFLFLDSQPLSPRGAQGAQGSPVPTAAAHRLPCCFGPPHADPPWRGPTPKATSSSSQFPPAPLVSQRLGAASCRPQHPAPTVG